MKLCWRTWLVPAVSLALEYPSEGGFRRALFLGASPVPGVTLDLAGVLAAVTRAPPSVQEWALQSVQASAPLLTAQDPVLALLLARRAFGPPADAREAALLAERLDSTSKDTALMRAWTLALRDAFSSVLVRRDQPNAAASALFLRRARLSSDSALRRVRSPRFAQVPEVPSDPVAREAAWLLSCDSVRLGARRVRSSVLVHAPAYLLVARLLGREVLGASEITLPVLGATRDEWFAAAAHWTQVLRSKVRWEWKTARDPHAIAEAAGWGVQSDVPMLALRAEALEWSLGGRAAELPAVAASVPSARGQPAHFAYPYGEGSVLVARRKFKSTQPARIYYEPPFEVPADFIPRKFQSLRVLRRQLYDLSGLARLSAQGVFGAAEFYSFAKDIEPSLQGGNFEKERKVHRHLVRVEEVVAGTRVRLGPLTPLEEATVTAVLDSRARGPMDSEFWAEITSLLPGRKLRAVRKLCLKLVDAKAASMPWDQFRLTGYWPGGDLSRALYAKHAHRT